MDFFDPYVNYHDKIKSIVMGYYNSHESKDHPEVYVNIIDMVDYHRSDKTWFAFIKPVLIKNFDYTDNRVYIVTYNHYSNMWSLRVYNKEAFIDISDDTINYL